MSVEKYKTEKALKDKIDKYFKMCDSKTIRDQYKKIIEFKPYTSLGLCLYLDISENRYYEHYCKKYTKSTTYARMQIENYTVEGTMTGKIPTKAGEFVLKNNFKWQDKSIVENHNTELKIEVKSDKDKEVIDDL